MSRPPFDLDVGVVGGAGHVGLPLALTFAEAGKSTVVYDVAAERLSQIRRGEMPFSEVDGAETLARALASGRLRVDDRPDALSRCRFLVFVVGTPLDAHLNPNVDLLFEAIEGCAPQLRDGQVLILRSTIYPGTSENVRRFLADRGLDIEVAFCPERVAQGRSLPEFKELPQIVSAFDPETLEEVAALFAAFAPKTIRLTPAEAELCKLMTNAWRYLQFACVNQFYAVATEHGLDFHRILNGCREDYPRTAGMPNPGFAAGPCLRKDTMQLAAFGGDAFQLGLAAIHANEGMPAHLIELAARQRDLRGATAGVLGLAFKADSDDPRDSLSYKLKKLLRLSCRRVLVTDPFVPDPEARPLDEVVEAADVLFVATPHAAYRGLALPPDKLVIDPWAITAGPAR